MKAKKLLIIMLSAVTVVCSALALTSCKSDDKGTDEGTIGLAYYPLDDGTYAVAVGETLYLSEIIIPANHNGKPVSAIIDEGFQNAKIKSITIPNSVTSIGSSAFNGCINLTNVIVPDSVKNISFNAFFGCNSLENITLPFIGASTTETENTHFGYIFGGIDSLNSSDRIPSTLKAVTLTKATRIDSEAFYNCDSLTSVTIPNSVTHIGDLAFYNCDCLTNISVSNNNATYKSIDGNLYDKDGNTLIQYAIGKANESFTIPDSVKNISQSAFNGCTSLTNVIIPDNVTEIGDSAFKSCTNLTNISIGNGVTAIKDSAFYGCSSLASVSIPDSVTNIGESIFNRCSNLASAIIGKAITSISTGMFTMCRNLTNIVIPDGVTSIGAGAFSGCTNLENVIISNSVTSIGNSAFSNCNKLKSLIIPNSVTSIGANTFDSCTHLTNVTIGKNVNNIGNYAFRYCPLTNVIIPKSVTTIGLWAFEGCNSAIYCEAENKPSGWSPLGNNPDYPVYWYSEIAKTDCWHYVDGAVTLW